MNDQSIIFGYLAFSCLKKLIKQVELLEVIPSAPYLTLNVKLPFELEETFLTIFKEELRGVIKKSDYKFFEMMPEVALNYAKSKNLDLEIYDESHIVRFFETEGCILEVPFELYEEELALPFSFDLFEIKKGEDSHFLIFGTGNEVKALKKSYDQNKKFSIPLFLEKAQILHETGAFTSRGLDLLSYYKNLLLEPVLASGALELSENILNKNLVVVQSNDDLHHDPIFLGDVTLVNTKLHFSSVFGTRKVNTFLKHLQNLLKTLGLESEVLMFGKFGKDEPREISEGLEAISTTPDQQKGVQVSVFDAYKRPLEIVSIQVLKKNVEYEIDVLKLLLAHISVHKLLFPRHNVRPRQVAVAGDMQMHPELGSKLVFLRSKGEVAFALEKKDAFSDKEALDYQIDNLIYYCESEKVIKERSFI